MVETSKTIQKTSWLLWTGLLMLSTLLIVTLGSGIMVTGAESPMQAASVSKSVDVPLVEPGTVATPRYTVTFSNPQEVDLVLDAITDTLPAGFLFVDMAYGSDWGRPDDDIAPEIVWQGPITVPAKDTLSLVYSVLVPGSIPRSTIPYTNAVEAVTDGGAYLGPASAGIVVGAPVLTVTKKAWPLKVINGDPVTYTVVFSNSGEVTGTLTVVTDTMHPTLTFVDMVAGSDVMTDPIVASNVMTWTNLPSLAPQDTLTLKYMAQTPTGDTKTLIGNVVEVDTGDGVLSAEAEFTAGPELEYLYLPVGYRQFMNAYLIPTKTVAAEAIEPGSTVIYTATIVNIGDTSGTLTTINDTLPTGFVFNSMHPNSDVGTAPAGTTGTIVWTGPWTMDPQDQIQVVYRVTSSTSPGDYVNTIELGAERANTPEDPVTATVRVEQPIAGLSASHDGPGVAGQPTTLSANVTAGTNVIYTWDFGDGTPAQVGQVVQHIYAIATTYVATVTAENALSQASTTTDVIVEPGILLDENFDAGLSPSWVPFTNAYAAEEGQWYWVSNKGVNGSGAVTWNPEGPNRRAEDGLMMYLAEGAEEWTDYRIDAKVRIETPGHPQGLWIRGQWEPSDIRWQWVTGYYLMIGGSPGRDNHYMRLLQLQTLTDCSLESAACPASPDHKPENIINLYNVNNPWSLLTEKQDGEMTRYTWHTVRVEVRGANIKGWIDGVQHIDYTDTKEPFLTGTIGFKTFAGDDDDGHVRFDDIVVTPLY